MDNALIGIAIQLKGTLSFLLGLGGMFTIVKGIATSILLFPEIKSDRPSIKADVEQTKTALKACAILACGLFVAALYLYFGTEIVKLDPDALKAKKQLLSPSQRWDLLLLAGVAVALVVVESASAIWRNKLSILASRN